MKLLQMFWLSSIPYQEPQKNIIQILFLKFIYNMFSRVALFLEWKRDGPYFVVSLDQTWIGGTPNWRKQGSHNSEPPILPLMFSMKLVYFPRCNLFSTFKRFLINNEIIIKMKKIHKAFLRAQCYIIRVLL